MDYQQATRFGLAAAERLMNPRPHGMDVGEWKARCSEQQAVHPTTIPIRVRCWPIVRSSLPIYHARSPRTYISRARLVGVFAYNSTEKTAAQYGEYGLRSGSVRYVLPPSSAVEGSPAHRVVRHPVLGQHLLDGGYLE